METNEVQNEFTEETADSLLNDIEPSQEAQIQEAKPQEPDYSWSFKANGKDLKLDWLKDREQIQKWAEHGYGSTNKIAALNKQIEAFQKKDSLYQDLDKKYGQVDAYVRDNPQFWEHVLDSYQKKELVGQDQNNPMMPVISDMQKKMNEMSEFIMSQRQEKEQMQAQKEDTEYMNELESIKKTYPKIDFDTPDENGKSLEYKILEHAKKIGVNRFVPAFRDFYHDELMKIHQEQAKEAIIANKQKNTKLGILGTSETPVKRRSDDVRGKSWNDLEREAIEELGLN